MTTPPSSPRDYLALIGVNGMGTTHRRERTNDTATLAKATAKQARKDWHKLFNIPKGHVWTVSIYDVTDHPNVYFDPQGVHDEATHQTLPLHSIERPQA